MKPRKITVADVCDITGYRRDELNYVLKEIPHYAMQQTVARVARLFTPLDLITLGIVHFLDKNCGVRLRAIADVNDQIRQTLTMPRSVGQTAWLLVSICPPRVEYFEQSVFVVTPGVVVPLQSIFERVDHFCNAFRIESPSYQSELDFGTTLMKAPQPKVAQR